MFDPVLRRLVDGPLDRAGAWLARGGVPANGASLVGLAVGLLAVPALAQGWYGLALLLILLNRLIDGVDGPIARHSTSTPFGGYLDIMCDMAFYAAVPVGFALADPANAVWAAILLASFVCSGASFLGRAVLAEIVLSRRGIDRGQRDHRCFCAVLSVSGRFSLAGRSFRWSVCLDLGGASVGSLSSPGYFLILSND